MRIRFKNQFVYYGSARVDPMLKSFFAEFRQDQVAINVTLNQWNDVVISLFMIAGMQIT